MKRGYRKPPSSSYVMRSGMGAVAFVPDPLQAGRWLRVSPCVVFKDCHKCEVKAGVPCRSRSAYTCGHHCIRADGFRLANFTKLAQRQVILERDFILEET
jgi:hypothetical protein